MKQTSSFHSLHYQHLVSYEYSFCLVSVIFHVSKWLDSCNHIICKILHHLNTSTIKIKMIFLRRLHTNLFLLAINRCPQRLNRNGEFNMVPFANISIWDNITSLILGCIENGVKLKFTFIVHAHWRTWEGVDA